ncbi:MAG: sulfatase-like hydrolase/transferase [Lentisphaeria bacterium]|nr:sulfatase-like hydrolase/transferase [Lentisphaeria bacterium]
MPSNPNNMAARRPSVVIIQTDEHVWNFLGCMGNQEVKTPNLDRLAGRGMLFQRSYACSGVCVPSRACFHTGRYPIAHGVTCNTHALPPRERTMGKIFGQAGYHTGYFGKTHFGRPDQAMTTEGWHSTFLWHQPYNDYLRRHQVDATYPEHQEIRHPEMRYWDIGRSRIPLEHYFEKVITDHAITFIREHRQEPFLCYVSHIAPHGPFTPPAPYDRLYDPESLNLETYPDDCLDNKPWTFRRWVEQNRKYINERELRIYLAHLYGLISLVDDQVGRVLDTLQEQGLRQDTMVLFTSDHGDFSSDYGIIGKSWSMDERLLRTPLLVAGPEIAPGATSDALVENIDVLPTLLDFCSLAIPRQVQGRSFLPVLQGRRREHKDNAFAFNLFHDHEHTVTRAAVIGKRWKWVESSDFPGELYDLQNDPKERTNLAAQPELQAVIAKCQRELLSWQVRCTGQGLDEQDRFHTWEYQTNFYDETKFPTPRPANNPF